MIPYGCQSISTSDIDAVVKVLRSDFLTQGPLVPRFERAVADKVGAKYGVVVNSATSALHIACLALGLGPGDWLWTSANTFVASANCGHYCGARVDFVDIDPHTYNMSPEALAVKLEQAARFGTLPKVVIPVHFAGQSCEMAQIHALSERYDFKIIEDASHSIGGKYRAEPIGNGRFSDITIFSFHPVKIITTGEGGVALTNDTELAARMQLLRTHGITRDPLQMKNVVQGTWYYEQQDLGFNYRMTDFQAALGLSQLERLESFVARRQSLASTYNEAIADLPLILPFQNPDAHSAVHLYVIQVDTDHSPLNRLSLFESLRKAGIGVGVHYIPVHLHPYYRDLGFGMGSFPEAEYYYTRALSLPLYAGLTEDDQAKVIETLKMCLS